MSAGQMDSYSLRWLKGNILTSMHGSPAQYWNSFELFEPDLASILSEGV